MQCAIHSSLTLLALAAIAVAGEGNMNVEQVYQTHCASCHGKCFEGGQGGVLVDGEWKHGGSDADIFRSIAEGNQQMGMAAWKTTLDDDQIRALVVYLREEEKKAVTKGIEYPKPEFGKTTKTELLSYKLEPVVEHGLQTPWAIAFLPDGSRLVTEKAGRLRVVTADGKLDPKPIEGIPATVEQGQGGLMEVTIHPDYEQNGWVYLGLADGGDAGHQDPGKRCMTAVARGRIKDHQWTDQEWIYRPEPGLRSDSGVHFGTRFVFDKGYIYFPIGERGGHMQAHDLTRPNGKIHRLHDDGRVPEDNPFVGKPEAIPSIWTIGHRNPQGLAIDPRDSAIYSTEHGPRGGDELNLIEKGNNYGWPVVCLGMNYNGKPMTYELDGKWVASVPHKDGMVDPITSWLPSIATCGLDFYTGDTFPEWKNDLLVGALAQQEIRRLRLENHKVVSQEIILKDIGRVRDVATGPDGSIYVVLNGPDMLVRMVPE